MREKRKTGFRNLESGLFIIGEGLTEYYYFEHIKNLRKYNCQVKLSFFKNTSYSALKKSIADCLKAATFIICVYDMDVACREKNEKERAQLQELEDEYGSHKNVMLCPSMPCIEYWFLLHYNQKEKVLDNKKSAKAELRKYIPNYDTVKSFLKNEKWVRDMISGDKQKNAIDSAKKLNKEKNSYSDLYKAIEKLGKSVKRE